MDKSVWRTTEENATTRRNVMRQLKMEKCPYLNCSEGDSFTEGNILQEIVSYRERRNVGSFQEIKYAITIKIPHVGTIFYFID